MTPLLTRIQSRIATERLTLPPPSTPAAVADEERRLGFPLPPLLKSLYVTIANGGFGPGCGLLSVTGNHAPDAPTLAEIYQGVRDGATYKGDEWIDRLLPVCYWGCTLYSAVDCRDDRYTIYHVEACDPFRMTYTLDDFFEMWLADVCIPDQLGKTRGRILASDPATGRTYPLFRAREKS